jgi:hypothetical protein
MKGKVLLETRCAEGDERPHVRPSFPPPPNRSTLRPMLFRTEPSATLAISQPAHAWFSGQMLRAWAAPLSEPLLLAAEQHDIGWLDWETAPTFDARTGRPHMFRDVGASLHAPMWRRGVARAFDAWARLSRC